MELVALLHMEELVSSWDFNTVICLHILCSILLRTKDKNTGKEILNCFLVILLFVLIISIGFLKLSYILG